MPTSPARGPELRSNTHQQMLVDVGIVLQKAYGNAYARDFLESVNIPAPVIQRLLTGSGLRPMAHTVPRHSSR